MRLTVTYDPAKDAENYIKAIFDQAYRSFGRLDLREKLLGKIESKTVKRILQKVADRSAALDQVTKELTRANTTSHTKLTLNAEKLMAAWISVGPQIKWKLAFLYGRPFSFQSSSRIPHLTPNLPVQLQRKTNLHIRRHPNLRATRHPDA